MFVRLLRLRWASTEQVLGHIVPIVHDLLRTLRGVRRNTSAEFDVRGSVSGPSYVGQRAPCRLIYMTSQTASKPRLDTLYSTGLSNR